MNIVDQKTLREEIIKGLNIEGFPGSKQDRFVEQVGVNILKHLVVATYDAIPEHTRGAFKKLTESNNPAQMQMFLEKNIPNLQSFISMEIQVCLNELKELQQTS